MITLQPNAIKTSFQNNLHVVAGHVFNVIAYKKIAGFVSKYALQHNVEENDQVKYVVLDKTHCDCILKSTHGLPCVYE